MCGLLSIAENAMVILQPARDTPFRRQAPSPCGTGGGAILKIFKKPQSVRFIGHMTCYYTLRKQTNVYKYAMEGTNMKDDREILKRELMKLLDEIPLERLKALYIKALVASGAK